ncbi:MAG: hypothetical protein HKN39_07100 [Flavobacteriales bacterium]|nr:hypothetical protein [Flavobacteriales bacterium]
MSGIDKVHREQLREKEILKEIAEADIELNKPGLWERIKKFFRDLFS